MKAGFKDLTTWQKAYDLALHVYKLAKHFPVSEQYGLVSQMRRCAVSISANIAEGYERQYRKEYVQFLMIARGSLAELETYLMFAKDLAYITQNQFDEVDARRQEVGKLLRGLMNSLSNGS